jgi:hypothetical protein
MRGLKWTAGRPGATQAYPVPTAQPPYHRKGSADIRTVTLYGLGAGIASECGRWRNRRTLGE